MSSYLEEFRQERDIRRKLGPDFRHTILEPIIERAHDLRERDHAPFDEALNIAAGKTRSAYGEPEQP